MVNFDGVLTTLSDKHLLRLYCDLIEEMRKRKIVRSSNNPVSDYGEKVIAKLMSLKLMEGSNKGYDAIDEKTGIRYQIKSRRLTNSNGVRELGAIRNMDEKLFDYLIAVLFDKFFSPEEIWQIPIGILPKYVKYSKQVNGHKLILAGAILQEPSVKKLL